jgi:ABC-type lipoprotein release transport system permease subunit
VTLAAIALVVGVPVGVAVGRYAWRRFADDLAVLPVARTSGVPLVALIAATFAVAALASRVPARVGARTRPAEVLRSE